MFQVITKELIRTSLWSDMKHITRSPPIECVIKVTFLFPEALYAVSSFTLRPSINLSILKTMNNHDNYIYWTKIKEILVVKHSWVTWEIYNQNIYNQNIHIKIEES